MKIFIRNTIQALTTIAVGAWIPCLCAQPAAEDLVKKQEMVQKLFASVPLLPQNMRPFETLSFRYIREESTDNGVRWIVVKKSKVIFDIKKGYLKTVDLTFNPGNNRIEIGKNLRYKDKLYVYQYSFKGDSSFLEKNFDISEDWDCDFLGISRCDNIQDISYITMRIDWLNFWECKTETGLRLQDVLTNKIQLDDLGEIRFDESSDEIMLEYWMDIFTVSKSKGILTKKILAPFTKDWKNGSVQFLANSYISKKGLPIPLVIDIN